MRRHRRISFGTIAMLLIACVTVSATFGLMLTIRRDEGDLTMDAEKLLDSVTSLMEMSQRHIGDEPPAMRIEVSVTAVPGEQNVQQQLPAATESVQAAQITNTPAPQTEAASHTVSITFGGTAAFESSVLSGAYDKETKSYRFDEMLGGIASAVHADLNFAVLETLLTDGNISDKDLLAPSGAVAALTKAGFDTIVLCSENALAGGEIVINETQNTLTAHGIVPAGLYLPGNARRYDMMQVNGVHLAVLSYTDSLSAASKKAVTGDVEQESMIHLLDAQAVRADVKAAKSQGAQTIIAFVNWGSEDALEPSADQKQMAQVFCDAGVDMLLGYNSKHVQPVELLISKEDPTHNMLTAWSLGTLLSEDRATRGVVSGMLLHVQFTFNQNNGSVNFDRIEYTPTYCWRQEEKGIYPYRVVRSDESVPEGMIQKQREILARALVLIQTTMKKGIAVQR